ncbi:hypothetical protein FS935_22025 [Metabacillus litoralis]|uniref:Uncharacterized protein n=1 Tax=Metabacillus litoralis TaxID=152268 RepID=A0A5C6V8A7_9BACI|nr:hypothetical protein [Metabacillus litoralis]TXC81582.1 hypothetical protein FS935_22025 [Metabacillus litoralis]
MKRAVGIFLSFSAILTYLLIDTLYYPVEESITNDNSGVTTVTYNYPLMYWLICFILIITFILGIYFILAKENQLEEYPFSDASDQ